MIRLVQLILLSSALLAAAPSLASECDEDTAADLNSRIEANFTIAETADTQDAAVRDRIEALRQEFSEAGKLHSEALDKGDQAGLNEACSRYQSILEEQAGLGD